MTKVKIRSIHWEGMKRYEFEGKYRFDITTRTFTVHGSDGKLSIYVADVTSIIVEESVSDEITQSEPDRAEA